jgi:hypothetical protein
MKRLNPKTNKPFCHGDVREDGFVFVSYQPTRLRSDGTFKENWYTPEKFKLRNEYIIGHHAKNRLSNSGRSQQLINSAKGRVKKTGGEVTVDKLWVKEKLDTGVCELTGLKFDLSLSDKTRMNPFSPSLDRIDPENQNYSEQNTRVVLTAVNLALSEFGEKTMLPILEAMVKSIKRKKK